MASEKECIWKEESMIKQEARNKEEQGQAWSFITLWKLTPGSHKTVPVTSKGNALNDQIPH